MLAGVQARIAVALTPSSRTSRNVIGIIEGDGALASESVIIGAHYDHVGMGGYGSLAPGTIAIHNGADDNASGTAGMLEIGRLLVQRFAAGRDHRRIVLIAFTGEERGLLGSQYYVRHPPFGLSSVQTMINLDMIGRLRDNELTVYGVGSGAGLESIVDRQASGFNLLKVATGYGPSDHQSFYVAGVPVLFFFTGLHNDYHRPSDDVEKLAAAGLVRVVDAVTNIAEELATRSGKIEYVSSERSGPVPIRRQITVRMGISMRPVAAGIEVSAVVAGSPAETAGIQIGDVLAEIAGTVVTTPDGVLNTLREFSPGNEIEVQILRRGEQTRLKLTLASR